MESLEEIFIKAISQSDTKRINWCLAKGGNPNKICTFGMTPLGFAVQKGNLAIVKLLAESQKNVINKRKDNFNMELSELSLDFSVNKGKNRNIGYFVVCRDIDDTDFGDGPTPDGMEGLEWDMEIDNSNDECVSSTPPEAQIYKWYADILNRTAIILESPENDISRLDKYGLNILHYAIREGHCDIAEYLIDNFKEISVDQSDSSVFSPLQSAVLTDNETMVKLLIKKGANVNYANQHRRTPLHFAAQKGNIDIVTSLLENGANVNAQDIDDCTPLSRAISYEQEEVAKLLIRKGTRLNGEESGGVTVLYRAVWNNMSHLAKALLDAGAKIVQSHFLLHIAIRHNNCELTKILHQAGALLNVKDDQGHTPLMLACIYKNLGISKYLLENGASVHARNEMSDLTALHICVNTFREPHELRPFLKLLLSYGANINASSFMGSALFYSIIVGNIEGACELIKFGADVNFHEQRINFTDNLSIARNTGNFQLVKLVVFSGFNFSSASVKFNSSKVQGDDPLSRFIVNISRNPLNLRDLCRIRIRKLLKRNVLDKIYVLPLPPMLQHYLALEE